MPPKQELSPGARAELAFKAFRNLAPTQKQDKLKTWFEKMEPAEIKQTAMLLSVLIQRDRNGRNHP